MGKYDTLLKYQSLDEKQTAIQREIDSHEFKKNMEKNYKILVSIQDKLNAFQTKSDALVDEINSIKEGVSKCVARIDEIEQDIDNLDDDRKIILYAELSSTKTKLESASKLLGAKNETLNKMIDEVKSLLKVRIQSKSNFDTFKEKYNKYRESRLPEKYEIEKEMKELEPLVDKGMLDIYKAHRTDVILPLFFEANENSDFCYCGMELSHTAKSELKSKMFCRCENCKRYAILNK